MCSLARPSALGCSDATYRRRGVMAREPPPRLVGAIVSSAARNQKRARDSLDGKAAGAPAPALPGQQRLQERMKAELDAVRALHRKAVLLCRGGSGRSGAGKGDARFSAAAGPRREAPSEAAAKRRKTSPTTKPAAEAAHRIRPVKPQPPSKRAAAGPPLPERNTEKAKDAEERRRRMEEAEEMARAREECRRQMLAMEMAALPDETVYPHELEELGIAPFEYAVTRTRSQAQSQDRILMVGVAY
ncbi:unnamed protein product [Urochloa humidicola]